MFAFQSPKTIKQSGQTPGSVLLTCYQQGRPGFFIRAYRNLTSVSRTPVRKTLVYPLSATKNEN